MKKTLSYRSRWSDINSREIFCDGEHVATVYRGFPSEPKPYNVQLINGGEAYFRTFTECENFVRKAVNS